MTTVQTRTREDLGSVPDDDVVARADGLSKIYGSGDASVVALDNVTVEFGRGRLTAIMGPSGSGTRRLLREHDRGSAHQGPSTRDPLLLTT